MAAREAKMALRIARWPSGKKDEDPGTLDERPGTKKSRREAKKTAGKPRSPSGSRKSGTGRKKRRRAAKKFAPGAGFFDKRSTSGGRWAGPSSWRSCIDA